MSSHSMIHSTFLGCSSLTKATKGQRSAQDSRELTSQIIGEAKQAECLVSLLEKTSSYRGIEGLVAALAINHL